MLRPVLTLTFLAALSFFVGLGRQAITDSDEGFYAEAAREMVETGDWLTPRFNYGDRWQKPILYYWATAATYLVTGPAEAAARWWSALSGVAFVLLTWIAARSMGVGRDVAWLAGAIVATCFGSFALARLALPDMPLAAFITLAVWAGLEGRWLLAGAAAGAGFLMKGPVALAIPALVLGPICWRERRTFAVSPRTVVAALLAFTLVGLPWYGAMTVRHGADYLYRFFIEDNLERFATGRFNEPRPIWFYLPIAVGGLFPWSLYAIATPWRSVVDVLRRRRQLAQEEWRLLFWIGMPLLFFTLSIGKQPRYILPVLPPLAILTARVITRRVNSAAMSSTLAAATWATAGMYAIVAILLHRARPLFIAAYPPLTYLALTLIGVCVGSLVWLATARQWRALPATMTACALVVSLSLQFGALAGVRPEPVERMAALVQSARRSLEPVGAYNVFVRNLVFYTRVKQVELFDEASALDFLKSPDRVLLVVREIDLPRLEAISGVMTKRLGHVEYVDTANIRLRTLLSPIPEQDVETVLLVSNKN